MPAQTTVVTTQALTEEQVFLDLADHRRRETIEQLHTQLSAPIEDLADQHRHALLAARLRALVDADHGLVLGRLDTVDEATYRIGRVGIARADGGEPLVLDWRADAARPFYTATALEPQGVSRRRHIRTEGTRVTGVDDESLADGSAGDLVGEAALLAALDEGRTGRMGTAIATLQREQDAIVRSPADALLVVQGGPGTGKTVVALHRVAYLLFAQPEIARRGVLLLGPSRRFLSYVEQVLPALGETAVVATTCDALVPGAAVEREETREAAELKGRALWAGALERHVASYAPTAQPLTFVLDGEAHRLGRSRVARVLASALTGGRTQLAAREVVLDALREALVDAVVEATERLLTSMEEGLEDILGTVDASLQRRDDRGVRTGASSTQVDGEMSEDDIEALRTRIESDAAVQVAFEAWWPAPDAQRVLADLLHDASTLARVASELTPQEVATVVAEPPGLASSDIALLDAVTALIGTPEPASPDGAPFLAQRAAADHAWTYGHVVIDEAQELSPMQWHMVRRRSPTGSVTAVGDIDQTEAPHRHTDWAAALSPAFGDRWRRDDLTICYRTPREVMALVGNVLERAGSTNEPPQAVRSSGREPSELVAGVTDLGTLVRTSVTELRERYPDGSVGVVAARVHRDMLQQELRDAPEVPVLTAQAAKGLEWDACVVVDPARIAAGPRGWNALYVALTRCTQELVQVQVVDT
ncbi:HelD family protein [Pseudactinotalea sp.]|uniref:HelD family protein n=1 Tax=Pseudactinotalea sp. TaxID=1926260 RepID=UPI003B3B7268